MERGGRGALCSTGMGYTPPDPVPYGDDEGTERSGPRKARGKERAGSGGVVGGPNLACLPQWLAALLSLFLFFL